MSTTLSLPKHQDKCNTGIRTRTPRHPSRRLLAVVIGLSGSAQHAATSGKLKSNIMYYMTAVAPAVAKLMEGFYFIQHLKQCSTHCCLNGTMSKTLRMAFTFMTPPLAAKSWCIGSATIAPRDSCTCIECRLKLVPKGKVQVVHIVLASKCADAILCKLIIPWFHQNGTLPEMT